MKIKIKKFIGILLILIAFLLGALNNFVYSYNGMVLSQIVSGTWTYCDVEKEEGTTKELNEIIPYSKVEDLGSYIFYDDGTFSVKAGGILTEDMEKVIQRERKYHIQSNNAAILETPNSKKSLYYNDIDKTLTELYQIVVDQTTYKYKLILKCSKNLVTNEKTKDKIIGTWTYSTIENKKGTTKNLSELITFSKPEDLGSYNFYTDGTFGVKVGGIMTRDIEKYAENKRTYTIMNSEIVLETQNLEVKFYYDEENNVLVEEYEIVLDQISYGYILTLKMTQTATSSEEIKKKLLGTWKYCSVEKKDGTSKELKELVSYDKIEDLGAYTFDDDGIFSLKTGGIMTQDMEKDVENKRNYSVIENKIVLETQNLGKTFYYDVDNDTLIENYQMVSGQEMNEYILTLKKDDNDNKKITDSNIDEEKRIDNTISKNILPKAGKNSLVYIGILICILLITLIYLEKKKNMYKDI